MPIEILQLDRLYWDDKHQFCIWCARHDEISERKIANILAIISETPLEMNIFNHVIYKYR